ncbi:hypothetical protein U9M48_025460 [Paspalum notatum var. saurae]|uniref:Transposase n=1 Tax=Paspalum notatum var. saurae TaxID=547442 RepID=A0AAQ3TQH1_PASNO
MCDGWDKSGGKAHSAEWRGKTQAFLDHALSLSTHNRVRCPCNKHNIGGSLLNKLEIAKDLVDYGFTPDYETWTFHGEKETRVEVEGKVDDASAGIDRMDEMLEALQPEFGLNSEDPPTKEVEEFFKLLKASEESLHEHTKLSVLAFVTRLIAIKSKYFFSNNCFNDLLQLIGDVLPQPHKLPKDMYHYKRLTKSLEFAKDARNIRFGLATDGFTPFSESAAFYSCWAVFAIPYNLPPSMCMKYEFMFLCLIIPGPKHPGIKLNVMLQPLIKELKQLWIGVEAYDISLKQKFTLRAVYLWSIHDFLAYGIFAGWSIYGILTRPICGANTRCFRLEFGGKICYFDCHRCWLPSDHIFRGEKDAFRKYTVCYEEPQKMLSRQKISDQLASLKLNKEKTTYKGFGKKHNWTHISGIWDLSYTKALKLPHNIDVMHQKRNVAENTISTCMDFSDKTKNNVKARKDLAKICNRPTLELIASGGKPRAPFCLKPQERKEVLRWMKNLKFPDGYAAGLRRAVNLKTEKLNGLKALDYHIIMERLLCAKEIKKVVMEKLEKDLLVHLLVLICKMEKNFSPGWMFHMERALKYLRAMVGNKARVERCIAETFILKEISYFSGVYFAEEHNVNVPTMRYNVDEESPLSDLEIFQSTGTSAGTSSPYYFKLREIGKEVGGKVREDLIQLSEGNATVRSHGRMNRRIKQAAKGLRLFQGTSSSGSRREALLRCVDPNLQGVPIALQRTEDEEDEGEEAGVVQQDVEAGEVVVQRREIKKSHYVNPPPVPATADKRLIKPIGNRQWKDVTWDGTGHRRTPNGKYFRVEPLEVDYAEKVLDQAAMKICKDAFSNLRIQTRHPLFADQPGPYKSL